jgi:serine/threonine-protein kinase
MPDRASDPVELGTADFDVEKSVRCATVAFPRTSPPASAVDISVPTADEPSTTPPVVQLEPHLVDHGELARGGMGSIRLVFDKFILRLQAMKVIDAGMAENNTAQQRFLEEAQITGQLEHPNILPVYGISIDDAGQPRYFTMKLARGSTLQHMLDASAADRRTGHELERYLRILLKICEGISFAHSRGVVHRDLKPDNIMVGSHGQVYVMDWGCALLLDGDRPSGRDGPLVASSRGAVDELGTVIGTVVYMAPEQAKGLIHEIDWRADVYALGGILYRILTDKPPHKSEGGRRETLLAAQSGNVMPPEERAGRPLPKELCRIAMKAMSKDKNARYQTVEAFAADIERFLKGGHWFATKVFAKGALVINEGDEADAAFIIIRGSCEAFRKTPQGERVALRRMSEGDVFGEAAILMRQARTASVEALEELEVAVVTRESLEQELAIDSWLGSLVHALARRFGEIDAELARQKRRGALRTWIDAHFAYVGKPGKGGRVEAPFKPLADRLAEEMSLSEDDLRAIIEADPNLSIEGDLICRP